MSPTETIGLSQGMRNDGEAMSHTPGPWREDDGCIKAGDACVVCFGHGYDDYGGIEAPDVPYTLRLPPSKEYTDKIRANTALVAAAPELLEALKLIVKNYNDLLVMECYARDEEVFTQAEQAIAKAEGQ